MTGRPEDTPLHLGEDGVWRARPTIGRQRRADGTSRYVRKRMSFPGARSERAARRMLREELRRYGGAGPGAGPYVPEMLYRYIETARVGGLSAASARTYRSLVANQVEPWWSGLEAADVEPYMVDDLYASLADSGLRSGEGCSTATLAKLHGLLVPAFAWMEGRGVVERDPMARVARPRERRGEAFFLDEDHLELLLPALGEMMADPSARPGRAFDRVCATACYLTLRCGPRSGEALALLPRQFSRAAEELLVDGTVTVSGGPLRRQPFPKSGRSRRMAVGGDVLGAVGELEAWRATLPGRPAEGLLCVPSGGWAGRWMYPSSLSRWFKSLARRLGLPQRAVYHSLRHTCAAILLNEGVDFRELQERFGHASASTTIGLYGHTSPARDRRAAQAVARYIDRLGGAAAGRGA